jgi:hypothetical protein
MKTYNEEDLRLAFKAGVEWGVWNAKDNYFDEPLTENEYIESLNPEPKQQEKIPITYGQIKAVCGWSKFCDVTGSNPYAINEGWNPSDTEIIAITKEQYNKLF